MDVRLRCISEATPADKWQWLFNADFRRGKFDDIFRGQIAGFPRVLMLLAAKVSSRFLGWAAVFPLQKSRAFSPKRHFTLVFMD